jgi:hypothetical protein
MAVMPRRRGRLPPVFGAAASRSLAMLLGLAGCHGAARQADRGWMTEGAWLVEEPDGVQRLAPPPPGERTGPDSSVVDALAALVHGPDPMDTRRSDKRLHITPSPVANDRGIGFRLSVRW